VTQQRNDKVTSLFNDPRQSIFWNGIIAANEFKKLPKLRNKGAATPTFIPFSGSPYFPRYKVILN